MGLRPNSDEGKVEALAAFGNPDKNLLNHLKSATKINIFELSIKFDIQKIQYFYDIEWLKQQRNKIGDENFCASVQRYLEDTMAEAIMSDFISEGDSAAINLHNPNSGKRVVEIRRARDRKTVLIDVDEDAGISKESLDNSAAYGDGPPPQEPDVFQ